MEELTRPFQVSRWRDRRHYVAVAVFALVACFPVCSAAWLCRTDQDCANNPNIPMGACYACCCCGCDTPAKPPCCGTSTAACNGVCRLRAQCPSLGGTCVCAPKSQVGIPPPCMACPTGDDPCDLPTVVPAGGGTINGTTSGDSYLDGCVWTTTFAPEAVFQWTPAVSGTATIQTCGGETSYDTVLYVRSGTCEDGAEIACNDDSTACNTADACSSQDHASRGSRVTPTVTAGQTYYIVVDGYGDSCGGSSGNFTLTITPPTGGCSAPTIVPAAGGTFAGTTSGASNLSGCVPATANAPESVFQWTPAVSGTATIQTCGGQTSFDTVLYVRRGGCDGAEIACNDDTTGCDTADPCSAWDHWARGSRVTPTVTAGQTYYIVVDGFAGGCGASTGTFSLTITPPGG